MNNGTKRFYYRALWNFALREDLKELDIDFNGIDFGHSNLYENLLLTHAGDVHAIEDRARKETQRFIASRPVLPPNEEAIAPTYMKLAWRAQNAFDEAHALHRATYDIYVSDLSAEEKERVLDKVLRFYKDSRYAITDRRLDHQLMDRKRDGCEGQRKDREGCPADPHPDSTERRIRVQYGWVRQS